MKAIEKSSKQLLLDCGEYDRPVNSVRLARKCGIEVRDAKFTQPHIAAAAGYQKDGSPVIYVDNQSDKFTKRYYCAQALYFHLENAMGGKGYFIISYAGDFKLGPESRRFARALVMPQELFVEWFESWSYGSLGERNIFRLASILSFQFKVPKSSVIRRFKDLDLLAGERQLKTKSEGRNAACQRRKIGFRRLWNYLKRGTGSSKDRKII